MKITILTYGSRGDVQPFVPLSLKLMARGHVVRLAAPARFKSFVEQQRICFVPLSGDPQALSRRLNDAGFNAVRLTQALMNHAIHVGGEVLHQTEEACKEVDLIVHTFAHAVGAHTLACEMNIPDIHIQTFPMFTPTGDYPNITLPDLKIRSINRLTHLISQKMTWWIARMGFEQIRRRAGLPKRKLYFPFNQDPVRQPPPILCAWSPTILPASSDWASNVHVTGYFFFDFNISYDAPTELKKFLDAGEPPICVSFGSMVNREAEKIDQVVRESLNQTGQRGVILSGWGKVRRQATKDLLYVEAVPHDWLLPRCKMIIHHGGAGTTSAGLRAGIPNIVVPFTADQPFWGKRVHIIGAGPKPILVRKLSNESLVGAIVEARSKSIYERARVVGQVIQSENGVGQATDLIENYSNEFHMRK